VRSLQTTALVALAAALLAAPAAPARAGFLGWEVNEVFSNQDGSIQFVEFFQATGQNGNASFDGKQLRTYAPGVPTNDLLDFFTFQDDLPSTATAGRFALVATAGFAALDGAVQPDFIMPDGFLDLDQVVEIELAPLDSFSFAQGAIPTDGVDSLYRTGPPTGPNSPTNFAGDTGSIDLPEPAGPALVAACAGALAVLRRRGVAAV